jgi:hypothetical protein
MVEVAADAASLEELTKLGYKNFHPQQHEKSG